MSRTLLTLFILGFIAAAPVFAQEDPTASQEVTIEVEPINAIEIPIGSVTLTIDSVDPATGLPQAETDASTSYNVTTNGDSMKITGALDTEYSSGLSLKVLLGVPTASGGSATQRTLGTTSQDLVNGISRVSDNGVAITYTAEASVEVAPNTNETRTVTYTLTEG